MRVQEQAEETEIPEDLFKCSGEALRIKKEQIP